MKAAVFHKPKDIRVENVPDPRIEDPRDAIVRITLSAICGSDLHLYNGLIPQLRPLILGHEFMGVVEDVGSEVRNLQRGDRVVVPFSIACGRCWFCERNFQTQCENSNKEKYGPEGGLLDQKGGGSSGIATCTAVTTAGGRRRCACPTRITARARCRRASPTSR